MTPKLKRRFDRFMAAHEQHDLKVTFLSQENVRREGEGYPIKVELSCHNGECWMGFSYVTDNLEEGISAVLFSWENQGRSGK